MQFKDKRGFFLYTSNEVIKYASARIMKNNLHSRKSWQMKAQVCANWAKITINGLTVFLKHTGCIELQWNTEFSKQQLTYYEWSKETADSNVAKALKEVIRHYIETRDIYKFTDKVCKYSNENGS